MQRGLTAVGVHNFGRLMNDSFGGVLFSDKPMKILPANIPIEVLPIPSGYD